MMMKKHTAILFCTAFLIICLFPVWGRLLPGSGGIIEEEKRALARFPGKEIPLTEWPTAIEEWFGDRLAFRREAIDVARPFRYNGLVKAMEGKDGWLFFLGNGINEDLLRRIHFDSTEKNTIRKAQQETVEMLSQAGAAYVVFIAPDKKSIYPEYLPNAFQHPVGQSRLDQIIPILNDIPGLILVDPRQALISAKDSTPLYYLTDTHWNDLGAWIACKTASEIIKKDMPSVGQLTDADVIIGELHSKGPGDLSAMVSTQDLTDFAVDVTLTDPERIRSVKPDENSALSHTLIWENPDHPELPQAVVFHDSFGVAIRPYMSACFSRIVFVWKDQISMDIVREAHPDVVIHEIVERRCDPLLMLSPAEE